MCDNDKTCEACKASGDGTYLDPATAGTEGLSCSTKNSLAAAGIGDPCGPGDPEWDAQMKRIEGLNLDMPAGEGLTLRQILERRKADHDMAERIKALYPEAPARQVVKRDARDLPEVQVKSDGSKVERWRDGSTRTTSADGRSKVSSGPRFRAGAVEKSLSKADKDMVARRKAAGLRTRVRLVPVEEALRGILTKAERDDRRHRARLAEIARLDRECKADLQRHDDNARLRRLDAELAAVEKADREARINAECEEAQR